MKNNHTTTFEATQQSIDNADVLEAKEWAEKYHCGSYNEEAPEGIWSTILSCLNAQLEAADHIVERNKMVGDGKALDAFERIWRDHQNMKTSGLYYDDVQAVRKALSAQSVDNHECVHTHRKCTWVDGNCVPVGDPVCDCGHVKSAQSVDVDSLRKGTIPINLKLTARTSNVYAHGYNAALADVKALQPVDDVRVHDIAVLREDVSEIVGLLETYAEEDLGTIYNNRPKFVARIKTLMNTEGEKK